MVEDRVSEILHNFYESYPHMSVDTLQILVFDKLKELKESIYIDSSNTLKKYNLPEILNTISLSNYEGKFNEDEIVEIKNALYNREYITEVFKHIRVLYGLKRGKLKV